MRFLNEKQEGVVTDIIGNIAHVSVEGDFSIPVQINELVKVEQPISAKTKTVADEQASQNTPTGIFVAFERIADSLLRILIHNSSCDILQLAWYENNKQTYTLKKHAEVRRNDTLVLYQIHLENFADWPEFVIQQNQLFNTSDKEPLCCVKRLTFHAKSFHAAFKHCFFLNKQAYLFQLDEKTPLPDLGKLREHNFDATPASVEIRITKPEPVIDLHIEKLSPNEAHRLTEYQILQRQMDAFKESLEGAIVNNMQELVVIHGVGKNVLKNKILKYAAEITNVHIKCTPADFVKYGGGATKLEIS